MRHTANGPIGVGCRLIRLKMFGKPMNRDASVHHKDRRLGAAQTACHGDCVVKVVEVEAERRLSHVKDKYWLAFTRTE